MAKKIKKIIEKLENKRIAVVRIKGSLNLSKDVKKTLLLLRLYKGNTCVIIKNSPNYIGMLQRVKDFITWGELDEQTCKLLLEKRGKLPGKQNLTPEYIKEKVKMDLDAFVKEFMGFKKELAEIPGLKLFFKLNPPIKGHGNKGIKMPFSLGGALGYRKEAINDLLKKMI